MSTQPPHSDPSELVECQLPRKTAVEQEAASEAMNNVSNWNNMLLNARRKRGPCFDPATGMYQFPRNSVLYYSVTDPVRWRPTAGDHQF
ncbi:hypothetical protein H4R33_007031 [Dimargaris cristalligena]|uniref:Uncharacterized protein n=1 Tax=Dimargaris cristalligena TaxID=215637 RepID=A0A4P9ZZW2_9FUNG|nr:hypothetical protein H4R33_007031 [Dimargaris cristalligena]RKP39283.1 hypothetical protein BJ085DRAFT_38468 [Dimargaris cristalligena]|eukprot:RKP39283.1 hypothetical protein BJ085DRAFT_38468 [Dimargaris cristalligena]